MDSTNFMPLREHGIYKRLDELLAHFSALREDMGILVDRKRLGFPDSVLRRIQQFMSETGRVLCPCCSAQTVIGPNGTRLAIARLDHYFGPSSNGITNAWLICDGCNVKLRKDAFRLYKEAKFKSFQSDLHEWMEANLITANGDPRQPPLFILPKKKA